MANLAFADDGTKYEPARPRTGSSPVLVGGNGYKRDTPIRSNTNDRDPDKGTLPKEKGFSVQIGSELFRLSGASIMSDGAHRDRSCCCEQGADVSKRRPTFPSSS